LGFDSILSEKGNIAFSPDIPLDESCYREVSNADIFVLIVGGRYGSEASSGERTKQKDFFDRYESVTKKEFEEAVRKDKPTYILVESNVYSEFQTYKKNRANTSITYAHVDSVNIFVFIEDILSLQKNNPIKTFERFSEIETWLRAQWAGIFQDLLKMRSNQSQFRELSQEISELKQVNTTLKNYLESILKGATAIIYLTEHA
jgi:hypothetical protein